MLGSACPSRGAGALHSSSVRASGWLRVPCRRWACQKEFLNDNLTVSVHEILIEEIRHQPEPVLREVLHYLKFLARQRAQEDWSDVLPSREVEQEKLDLLDGK